MEVKKNKITKKTAAMALYGIAKKYEKVSFSTVYRSCYFSNRLGVWRYIGKAHDYSF